MLWHVMMLDSWWFKELGVMWIGRGELNLCLKEVNLRKNHQTWVGNYVGVRLNWLNHNQCLLEVCCFDWWMWFWVIVFNHHIPSHFHHFILNLHIDKCDPPPPLPYFSLWRCVDYYDDFLCVCVFVCFEFFEWYLWLEMKLRFDDFWDLILIVFLLLIVLELSVDWVISHFHFVLLLFFKRGWWFELNYVDGDERGGILLIVFQIVHFHFREKYFCSWIIIRRRKKEFFIWIYMGW